MDGLVIIVSYSRRLSLMIIASAFQFHIVGAFSVIVKIDCETDGSSAALAETFFFITHCLYLLSNCLQSTDPKSHVTYHVDMMLVSM